MTDPQTTLNIEHMNYYTDLRLDEIGIASDEEAEELEFELELRFQDFTAKDRKTWQQQNDYLDHFAKTGTLSSSARKAGVSLYTAQRWKYDNVLGFTRRLEMATLIFQDSLKEKALLRASDPKAPATLLIELLRTYIPEEFSKNDHKCDTSKSDQILRRFRENARRELEAGHPKLRKMAEGAENAYPPDDEPIKSVRPADNPPPGESDLSQFEPTSPNRHTGGGRYPEEVPPTPYGPQHDRHTPSSPSAPSALNPYGAGEPSRAQRREQLRQQRKEEKKNTFPVKRF